MVEKKSSEVGRAAGFPHLRLPFKSCLNGILKVGQHTVATLTDTLGLYYGSSLKIYIYKALEL